MKLVYKFLFSISGILILGYYLILDTALTSQNDVVGFLQSSNKELMLEQLEKRQTSQSHLQTRFLDFSLQSIASLATNYVVNYDQEGLQNELQHYFYADAIKAITVYDGMSKSMFVTLYKEGDQIVSTTKPPPDDLTFTHIISHGITYENAKIGTAALYVDHSIIEDEIQQTRENILSTLNDFSEKVVQKNRDTKSLLTLLVFAVIIMAVFLVLFISYRMVLHPLGQLHRGLNQFFLFLQHRTLHIDKINIVSHDEFGQMAASLNENIQVSARLHEEIHDLNANLEQKVREKTQKVTDLLDNAAEGFLSVDKDLKVDSEYSKECVRIFGQEIGGESIAKLLFEDNEQKIEIYNKMLESIFGNTPARQKKVILRMLDKEIAINHLDIHIDYKLIDNDKIMMILTDITSQKELEEKVETEQKVLKMVVSAIRNYEEFREMLEEFDALSDEIKSLVAQDTSTLQQTIEIYRKVHTFKGNFAQKNMIHIVPQLHQLESSIHAIIINQDHRHDELTQILRHTDLRQWISKDLDVLVSILGNEFLENNQCMLVHEHIDMLAQKVAILLHYKKHERDVTYEDILNDIRRLQFRPLKEHLTSYADMTKHLAQKLDKPIYPVEIIDEDDIRISSKVKPFIKSLVHIFRNSIDHGIEEQNERLQTQKDPTATISCLISKKDEAIIVEIMDDGRGIDVEVVKNKAISKGILSETTAHHMTKEEIYALLFQDTFSTKDEVSTLSGRGVGLAAVKKELEELGGAMSISSTLGKGTTFHFELPLKYGS